MKVLKVTVVGELPWTCSECKFLVDKLPYYCRILDRFVKEDIVFEGKPDWCPLVAETLLHKYKNVAGDYDTEIGGIIPSVESENK
jgi:hypothetical protein